MVPSTACPLVPPFSTYVRPIAREHGPIKIEYLSAPVRKVNRCDQLRYPERIAVAAA